MSTQALASLNWWTICTSPIAAQRFWIAVIKGLQEWKPIGFWRQSCTTHNELSTRQSFQYHLILPYEMSNFQAKEHSQQLCNSDGAKTQISTKTSKKSAVMISNDFSAGSIIIMENWSIWDNMLRMELSSFRFRSYQYTLGHMIISCIPNDSMKKFLEVWLHSLKNINVTRPPQQVATRGR